MIKAMRVRRCGGPEELILEDVELPPPAPGQIQIRQRAVGVNYIDVYRRTGAYPAELPFIPGHEGAGEVAAVGDGVEEFSPGDRVAYVGSLGGYAEARNIDAREVVHLPRHIAFETGASMMLKGLTAQYLLRRTFKVKKGHRVLIHAGAGATGQILCQWAKARGAKVVATVGSRDKEKIARAAGAKHVIFYREENFAERLRELTDGKLCDVVYDGVGQATFPASLDCLKPFGLFVSFGSASGPIQAFDLGLLAQKGSLYATRPSLFAHIAKRSVYEDMAEDAFRAVKRGDIRFPAPTIFKLCDAAQAHALLESRQSAGPIVLIP